MATVGPDDAIGTGQDSTGKISTLRSVRISTWVFLLVWLVLLVLYNGDWPTGLVGVGFILLIELFAFWCRDLKVKWYAVTVGLGMMAAGVAKLVWPAFPWLTRWMVFILMVTLLLLVYLREKRLLTRAGISEMAVTTAKYFLFALLLFFLPRPPIHNIEKVYKVYHSIKDDVLMFKDWEILRSRGGTIVLHTNGGRVPDFERNKASSGHEYSLVDRDRLVKESPEFYKEFGFSDEHSFMVHFATILGRFEDLELVHIYGRERLAILGLIRITVTYNDELHYYPDSLQIPGVFFGDALKKGELSKLDGNWFYVKRKNPIKSPF